MAIAVFALFLILCTAPSAAHVDSEHSDIIGSWTHVNSLAEIAGDGNYCLDNDVILTETWSVPSGKKINLCLNGHVIQQTVDDKSVIKVSGSKTQFNICDCSDEMHYFDKNSNGLWVLNDANTGSLYNVTGGVITGGKTASTNGGGVFINSGKFTLSGGNIVGNSAGSNGGGVYNGADFVLSGGNIIGNIASGDGGGVYSVDVFTMYDGKISGNTAKYGGGVIIDTGSIFTMYDGNILDNTAKSNYGGGVYNRGTFTMESGSITGNTAGSGGGVYNSGGTFTMNDGSILNNTASYGGGVWNHGTFTMESGSITGNKANYDGGGVYVYSGTFTMESGSITGNTAGSGGGVYVYSGTFTMNDGSILNNTASYGGGVWNNGTFTMESGSITGNKANYDGGGVWNHGTFTMNDGSISHNTAENNGGGVFSDGNTFTMNDGSISNNIASNDGGGLYLCDYRYFIMNGGSIIDNTAENNGGGVYSNGNTFTMSGGNIAGNSAVNYGGGVYSVNKVTMSGGNITDNTAESYGGNVYNIGAFTMSMGSITDSTGENNENVYNGGTFTMSGDVNVDDIRLVYYNNKKGIIRIVGTEFTGGATYITKTGMVIGDTIVEIDKSSTVSAKEIAGKFSLANEMMILGASEDDKKLVVEARVPKFYGATLSLSSDIAVRFYVLDASLVGCSNPYVNVKFNGTEYKIRPADDAVNKRKVFTFRNISPAEMNETIVADLYATRNGEGEPTLFATREYSVKQYCDNMLNKEGTHSLLKTLCVDLLNYGSASQVYTGETDASKFANYTLTPAQKSMASSVINPAVRNDQSISETGDNTVGVWRSASLNLYSDISLILKFTSDVDVSNLEAEIKYGVDLGETATVRSFTDSTYSGGDCKQIKFNKMNAQELNYPVEITLIDKTTGKRSKTLTYSVDAYSYSKIDGGGNLGTLVTSIMKYIRSVDRIA